FVPGFTEGLKMMRPGGRYQVIIPASLGYGERGVPGAIPPNAALDFTVDLLQVIPKPSN
ncbi:MAG: FKBP-type peptidyl-prolyl cis-trans isomerase, partial [Muribaculaceae bacterium]|nr:FKBP-type peptidyl-prolyl cis-trans isomerase [Muribaculaceae bacterium]